MSSKNTPTAIPDDAKSRQQAPSGAFSIKDYLEQQPQCSKNNQLSDKWRKINRENTAVSFGAEIPSENNDTVPDILVDAESNAESDCDKAEFLSAENMESDLFALPDGNTPASQLSANTSDFSSAAEPEEKEEPIPSLFEGIGRTDWSTASYEEYEKDAGAPDYDFQEQYDFHDIPPEILTAEPEESTNGDEDEPDVDELLDFIEDIEFSGMLPEPLKAVRYAATTGDPYNTAFNNPENDLSETETQEFEISSSFVFEKK